MTVSMPGTGTMARTRRPVTADVRLLGRQIVAELKMFRRNRAGAAFTLGFPIMFLVIFSALNGNSGVQTTVGKVGYATYYLPGIVGFSILTTCLTSLAINLTGRREIGLLKRKRGTPLPTWALLAGTLGCQLVVALVLTALTSLVSIVAFGVPFPRHLVALLGVVLLGAACFCALGIAITAAIPSSDAAPAVVNLVVFPLLFLSGTFFPITNSTLNQISGVLPIARLQQALFDSYAPPVRIGGHLVHAAGPASGDLLVLVVWLAVGVFLAVRWFRWEPRRG